ncbi:ABC-type multidrug transport system fused ATPase/permease subunit [Rhodococcus sp. 27YEA15]|uniref:ABC transporter transmembrane domain-containing protein n=1 Tax=Rhodococcus sp. 27YEA15 TaxID=3156259 RepID=UPI003C7C38D3
MSAPPKSHSGPLHLIRVGSFSGGRALLLVTAVTGHAAYQVAQALIPVLIGVVVDRAIGRSDSTALLTWLAVLTALFVGLALSWRIANRLNTRVFVYGEHDLRLTAARRVLDAHGMRTKRSAGEVLTISTSDASHVSGFSWVVAEQGSAFAGLAAAVTSLAVLSWPLAVIVVTITAAQLVFIHKISSPLDERVYAEQSKAAEAGTLATDFTLGLRVLKGIGAEPSAVARYTRASRESMYAAIRKVRALSSLTALNSGVSAAVLAAVTLGAAAMAHQGSITVGNFVAIVGLSRVIAGPMETLGFFGAELAAKRGSARRLSELLTEPSLIESGSTTTLHSTEADAEILRVTTDNGTVVSASRGELIGIRADDSAHRLALRLGYRTPLEADQVVVFGTDATALGPDGLRDLVFVSAHEGTVFTGTVFDNLATGALDPAAVTASALDDVLTHLSDGQHSEVGEQGKKLSGGQRQRLLLARALHQPQPVLVLHEPTTAVDSVTEDRIAHALKSFPGKTILIITSSPTLLHSCDRVVDVDVRVEAL